MLTLGILWGHVSYYIWEEPAEWPTRPQPHSLIPYCATQTELGFCYSWIYFIHTCMMQSRGSFFMPKKNLYFWIKMEWWWFYYFYCNNHYCHNSEPLSESLQGARHSMCFTCVTLLNGLEQKYFSETFITGPTLRCLCETAWAPLTHPVHSTSSASWAEGKWSLSSHANMRAPGYAAARHPGPQRLKHDADVL